MKNCKECGEPLKLGGFAYNQDTCWDCFQEQVILIATKCDTKKEAKVVMHLLDVAREVHRIPNKSLKLVYPSFEMSEELKESILKNYGEGFHKSENTIGEVKVTTVLDGVHAECSMNKVTDETIEKVKEYIRRVGYDGRETK